MALGRCNCGLTLVTTVSVCALLTLLFAHLIECLTGFIILKSLLVVTCDFGHLA